LNFDRKLTVQISYMKSANSLYHFIKLIIILIVILSNFVNSKAQQVNQWSQQEKMPHYKIFTEEPPFLIADQNRVIHAFNSQPLELDKEGSPEAVFYRRWRQDTGWSNPIDIIFNSSGDNLDLLGVYLDQNYVIHLVAQKDFEDIYYTQAPLAEAERVTSWTDLKKVGKNPIDVRLGIPVVASLSGEGKGKLVLIYSGLLDGNGLYYTWSQDNGESWSEPYPIYLTNDQDLMVVAPRMYLGESNTLHAVWSSFNADGSGGPGFYAQYDFNNNQWSEPVELDEPGIRTPNVIEFNGEIFVSYYHNNSSANWWRRSSDRGKTWSDPAKFSRNHVGTNGIVSFTVDSNNDMHAFFGQRINDSNHGMWHTIWLGRSWSNLESIVRGPQVRDAIGGMGFDPRSANAVISNGNLIFVTWGTDGAAGENGAWYSYTILDSPELPLVPLPTPMGTSQSSSSRVTESGVKLPIPSPTSPNFLDLQSENSNSLPNDSSIPLAIGTLSVIVIVSIPIIKRMFFRQNR
jgi:hypothetical protein